MTATTAPAPMTALAFYERALPQIEALLTMAREWRNASPCDEQAIEMHSAFAWLCIRLDLRLDRSRRAAGVMIGPGCPNGGFVGRRGAVCQRAAPTPGRPTTQEGD